MSAFRRLYLRLALATGLLFIVVGGVLIGITTRTSELYALETTQRINRDIALHAAEDMPLLGPDGVNQAALKELAHHVMFINPIVEVYLLDTDGNILSHALPEGTVLRNRVDMTPLQRFMRDSSQLPIFADDPRSDTQRKIFSVSPILDDEGEASAYLYTVLNGKDYDGVQQTLADSYNLQTGVATILAALCFAMIGGLLLFFLLTRRLQLLVTAVRRYREDRYTGVISLDTRQPPRDEVDLLGTAISDMSERIEQQFDAQTEIDRNRRELIANVSHDLRTPVSSIQGFLETLMVKDLDANAQTDYIRTAHKHALRLNELISELFELSTLESGSVEPHWENFPVMELIQDIVLDHEVSARERGITLTTEAPRESLQVRADIAMIHRLLENLIHNALRHTPQGGEITIRVIEDAQRVQVQVSDNGDGIASQDIPRIFERFYQRDTDSTTDSSIGGTGLGLAIVKRIVELHRSQIAVRSESTRGTEFSFWLPQPA
ncbi:sensor histidine kinase [Congregibacter litoralis]|uniref:histidine kinase n=1 Tax=Congregibacter litoralis KT71 TaxID=314285 RepID=A4A488_9GAMM|nr:ATP-binding protein [Congregibacter litoralis]EAQ99511.1 Signal transduction histidine kinase [Congregibacter litoralis KT71]